MPEKDPFAEREARLSSDDLSIFTSDLYGFWMMGRCVPSTCSIDDVNVGFVNFLAELAEWLESQELSGINLPDVTFQALNCHTEEEGGTKDSFLFLNSKNNIFLVKLEAGDYGYIAVLVFFGILILIGTISDVLLNIFHLDFQSEKFVQVFTSMRKYICTLLIKFNVLQIVQGFSAYTNTLRVFSTETVSPDSLESINGIRFLSISWVIVGHCYNMYDCMMYFLNQIKCRTLITGMLLTEWD